MKYALGNMLNGGIQGIDPDAKAYINTIVTSGATVTSIQKNAINTFVKAGKASGWWLLMKRIYFPIWSIASPNAVDMISRTSGTFIGTPTYGSSSVSFASSAYFDSGTSFTSQGLTASSGYIFCLVSEWVGTFIPIAGSGTGGNITALYRTDANNLRFRYSGFTEGSGQVTAAGNVGSLGIISGSRSSGDRKVYRRTGSSRSQVATLTSANSGTPTLSNVYFSALNLTDTAGVSSPSVAQSTLSSYGFGLGLSDAQESSFTLAIKNLWETCTGLVLP